jgi:galactokinase/mevalonate kinase-like predicted kinase
MAAKNKLNVGPGMSGGGGEGFFFFVVHNSSSKYGPQIPKRHL